VTTERGWTVVAQELDSDQVAPVFGISTTDLGATIALSVAGELDAVTAPQLQAAILVAMTDFSRLVIDLSELTFIDTIGLSVLLAAKKLSRKQSFQLFVIPSEHDGVTRFFALTDATKALI
jgi:anti-sigma B factor antagonist